ncbi:S1 RNA-binding domain-containing protein 1-like [Mytilus trossulus]|uniref:S1 RNA-binding domain-containing protein 1-like n=1 Tax=Mytilus trossulus TaxID=6551 RepID=UPI003003E6F1
MACEELKNTDPNWETEEAIAEDLDLPKWSTKNVVKLLEEGCTIPFIARYRKEMTGGMEVDNLRDIQSSLEDLKHVQNKMATVLKAINKLGKLTQGLEKCLKNSKTITEVDDLYAPFKPGHKGTLAERARALNLEPLAITFLERPWEGKLEQYVDPNVKGLQKLSDVETGVKHILADIIHKHKDSMDFIRGWSKYRDIKLVTSECKPKKSGKNDTKTVKTEDTKKVVKKEVNIKEESRHKYEQYFNSNFNVCYIKPHQVLAINRGEHNKFLTVKIDVPDKVKSMYERQCSQNFIHRTHQGTYAMNIITQAISDAYERLAYPQMIRLIRSELTKKAEKASIDVFATNLKNLLLASPVKGKCILGLDPGFKNGCKVAVITATGQIVHTEIVYIHDYKSNKYDEKKKILQMIKQYGCEIFAIGNGVACRESETYVSNLIKEEHLKMNYCVVDESGASIYSVSDQAKKELPTLDPSLRGAVSIARRLLDPLAELVKIEPKHIGVGQYQHDMPENQLKLSLDSVVEECVSFVGVDVNTGSESLLRRIAGLNSTRAKKIIEWRESNGLFVNRGQVKCVKGIGDKSYEQCAGFIRVIASLEGQTEKCKEEPEETKTEPEEMKTGRKRKKPTAGGGKAKKKKDSLSLEPNILDTTWIHPESYGAAESLMQMIGVSKENLGQEVFIREVQIHMKTKTTEELAATLAVGEPTVDLIVKAFLKPHSYDYREGFEKPLFRKEIQDINSLKNGTILTGKITNVTHFGAFVDIGVGQNGLIHVSKMKNTKLNLGDKVSVKVISLELSKKRIGLEIHCT